jgi:PPE-repeat protein
MLPSRTDIGALISLQIPCPTTNAAAEIYSAAVATESSWAEGQAFRYLSGSLAVLCGAPSGAPSSFAVAVQLQTSADGLTNWQSLPTNAAIAPLTAPGQANATFQLGGSLGFIRVAATLTFVGGTSPTIPVTIAVALGGDEQR